ncbi:S-layer homology domain-containing protein [Paenibacillus sp. YN15]|uniref:S-layer homology domain-containing protein n=1 Tax=Paenibacillus sp. YN15 TaxID=1742774 RepID=UPI0015EC17E4|nr:S-layer homology domain-containing protein [Paenibacillus sp. YN15]
MGKKVSLWFLSIVLLLGMTGPGWFSPAAVHASPQTDISRIIPAWSFTYKGLPAASLGLDTAEAHEGEHSLRLSYTSAKASEVYLNMAQTVTVKPNTVYELSLWGKGTGVKGVNMMVNWGTRTSLGTGTFDWKRISQTYTTGANETSLIVRIIVDDKTTVWLDDIVLKEAGTESNLLQNGDFDSIAEIKPLDGFEALSAWAPTGLTGMTAAEAVYETRTEGAQAAKLTFTNGAGQPSQTGVALNLPQPLDLAKMTTVTMDVYPLSQTVSANEPVYLKLTDASGSVSEVQLPKLLAGQWNGVKLEFAVSAVRSGIVQFALYVKTGTSAAGWEGRTSVSYLVDQVSAVRMKQPEGSPQEGETLEARSLFLQQLGSGADAPIFQAEGISIDGSLGEWDGYTGISLPTSGTSQNQVTGWTGAEDLSANIKFAYDQDYFYLSAKVRDNTHFAVANSDMWNGDSIQFAFGENGVYGAEYGLNLFNGQTQIWRWKNGSASAGMETVTAKTARTGNDTYYEARLPWNAIFQSGVLPEGLVSFSILVNDNDGGGRRGWLEWTSGIGKVKNGKQLGSLYPVPAGDPWSFWVETPAEGQTGNLLPYKLHLVNYSNEPRSISIRSQLLGIDRELTVPAGMAFTKEGTYSVPVKGTYWAETTVTDRNTGMERTSRKQVEVVTGAAELTARLEALSAKLPQLLALLAQAEGQGLAADDERIIYTALQDFAAYGKEDAAKGRLARSSYVAETLEELYLEAETNLQGYLNGTKAPQAAPRYITGPLEQTEHGFTGAAQVRSTGEIATQPIFLNGYLGFNQIRLDIGKLQDYGANVIQVETGPRNVIFSKEGYIPEFTTSGSALGSISLDEAVTHSGSRSLKIVNQSPKQSNIYLLASQAIPVKPNTAYEFKVWVKGENVKNAWFPGGPGWALRKSMPAGTYDWQEISYTYTTGPAELSFTLILASENVQTLWLDDLRVTEQGSEVNLVRNPGFEQSPVVPGADPDKEYVVAVSNVANDIGRVLENARDNNVAVNLLLSPHYFPDWVLKKHPETAATQTGFLKFNIDHPLSRQIIEDYLRAVIPLVKDYSSLQSVTLSNEPVYQSNRNPYYLPIWQSYLEELYGNSIAELNRIYGTAYTSFGEVQMPSAIAPSPVVYDWVTFNNKIFSDWHQWMADIIHEMAPDLPVQAKVMANLESSLNWGVDYERFSELSDINGNDAYNLIGDGPEGFIKELSFYDLQRSFKQAPIFNSEHHFIKDGDDQYVPEQAKRVRAVLWQGAVHGKSASTSWLWERTYDATSDFEGSLLHRPDVVVDIGKTNHDLNRLAGEVTALQNATPRTAILYSLASGVYDTNYDETLRRAYQALAYSGQRIGFVTEKQAAAGKLADYELLVVPAAAHVSAATLDAVESFSRTGGKVVLIGEESLARDEHNQPLDATLHGQLAGRSVILPAAAGSGAIRTALLPLLEQMDALPVALTDLSTGQPVWDAGWQIAEHNGRLLLNVANYTGETRQLQVSRDGQPAGSVNELIAGTTVDASHLELAPYGIYLLDLGSVPPPEENPGTPPPPAEDPAPDEPPSAPAAGGQPGSPAQPSEQPPQQPLPEQGTVQLPDIRNHWAENSIREAAAKGLISGYEDLTFRPDQPVTREELLVLLLRALEPKQAGAAAVAFADEGAISGWAKQAVALAVQAGWVKGYEDGTIRPQTLITRAEMAVLLMRAFGHTAAAERNASSPPSFADDSLIPAWAKPAVYEAVQAGLLEGGAGNRFNPNDTATRAEAVVVLLRLMAARPLAD